MEETREVRSGSIPFQTFSQSMGDCLLASNANDCGSVEAFGSDEEGGICAGFYSFITNDPLCHIHFY